MGTNRIKRVCVWQQIPSILCSQTVLLLVLRTGLGCIWFHCTGNKIEEAVNHVFILPALSALRPRACRPGTDGFSILQTLQNCYLPWIKDINAVNIDSMHACMHAFLIFVQSNCTFVLNTALLANACLKEILIFHLVPH